MNCCICGHPAPEAKIRTIHPKRRKGQSGPQPLPLAICSTECYEDFTTISIWCAGSDYPDDAYLHAWDKPKSNTTAIGIADLMRPLTGKYSLKVGDHQ